MNQKQTNQREFYTEIDIKHALNYYRKHCHMWKHTSMYYRIHPFSIPPETRPRSSLVDRPNFTFKPGLRTSGKRRIRLSWRSTTQLTWDTKDLKSIRYIKYSIQLTGSLLTYSNVWIFLSRAPIAGLSTLGNCFEGGRTQDFFKGPGCLKNCKITPKILQRLDQPLNKQGGGGGGGKSTHFFVVPVVAGGFFINWEILHRSGRAGGKVCWRESPATSYWDGGENERGRREAPSKCGRVDSPAYSGNLFH